MKVELRDPNKIMKLSRLGSFHQSKLSFLRSFLNEFKEWEYKRDLFNLNENGFGEAVYSFKKNKRVYSLICFANEIKDEERSDRVIATKWDAAFTLHDGVPTKKDIERLKNEVPKQEVGRLSYKELTLSRANKSVRIYNHVVESLSKGKQPDLNLLSKVGYLYRTTAVYGSGKFGLADRFRIKNREEINGPFRLEMMLVYLVRQFTFDQVNHVAYHKNPKTAVKLDDNICKNLGIGNSTGLGMAPFIVNHPTLLNNWILSREKALKKIREIKDVESQDSDLFIDCVKKSLKNITSWNTDSEYQQNKISSLLKDVEKFLNFINKEFDFGLTANIGYASVSAEDLSGMEAAQASTNYQKTALIDANNPSVGDSMYAVPHRFTFNLNYKTQLISGYDTMVQLSGFRSAGQPTSAVMSSEGLEPNIEEQRHLLYVPTLNDAAVDLSRMSSSDLASFDSFIADQGLARGTFVGRNELSSRWRTRLDLYILQEIPAFFEGAKGHVYLKMYNLGNFLSDDNGFQGDAAPDQMIVASDVNADGQHVYTCLLYTSPSPRDS